MEDTEEVAERRVGSGRGVWRAEGYSPRASIRDTKIQGPGGEGDIGRAHLTFPTRRRFGEPSRVSQTGSSRSWEITPPAGTVESLATEANAEGGTSKL